MGANFGRVKVWVSTEDVTYSDLNAEFDNLLTNLTAANVDDFSATVNQMQSTVDPGEVGTESKATSVAGEIQRLRFLIAEITGQDEWYESPTTSLLGLANAIGTGLTDNRLVSGRVRSAGTNNCPIFLVPNGAAKTVTVKGSTTNFVYYVDGVEYSITTDVNLTGLTAAPSSNNTCLVNESGAADDEYTKYLGENGSVITVDAMGTEISALVGSFAAFKLAGLATEYFIGYVKSTTEIGKCFRGYFFDSTDAVGARTGYTDNDVITLMKLTWVFAKTDGTLTATYNNPVWAKDQPTSPAVGDYWYDIANNTWKIYGVGSYTAANAQLIGACFQDATNTVGARSFEFFKAYNSQNTLELIYDSVTQVKARFPGSTVNVWGETIKADRGLRTWDITLDRDAGVSESASTYYYCYLTDSGDVVISDIRPYDRRSDLQGYYHPFASWRCVGRFFNSSGSDIDANLVDSYYTSEVSRPLRLAPASIHAEVMDKVIKFSGATATHYLPPAAKTKGQEFVLIHGGSSLTQLYTLTGFGSELIGATNTVIMYTVGETFRLYSTGTAYEIIDHKSETIPATWDPTIVGFGTTTNRLYEWWRKGNTMHARGNHTNGTLAASLMSWTLPTAVTIATMANTTNAPIGIISGNGAGSLISNMLAATGTSTILVYAGGVASGAAMVTPSNGNVGPAVNSQNQIVHFSIPVSGWLP